TLFRPHHLRRKRPARRPRVLPHPGARIRHPRHGSARDPRDRAEGSGAHLGRDARGDGARGLRGQLRRVPAVPAHRSAVLREDAARAAGHRVVHRQEGGRAAQVRLQHLAALPLHHPAGARRHRPDLHLRPRRPRLLPVQHLGPGIAPAVQPAGAGGARMRARAQLPGRAGAGGADASRLPPADLFFRLWRRLGAVHRMARHADGHLRDAVRGLRPPDLRDVARRAPGNRYRPARIRLEPAAGDRLPRQPYRAGPARRGNRGRPLHLLAGPGAVLLPGLPHDPRPARRGRARAGREVRAAPVPRRAAGPGLGAAAGAGERDARLHRRTEGGARAVSRAPGQVRIIGGRWRGTRLPVADAPGLRPTPDRTRETLFNWLAPVLPGARVLDLFAGSGALGFEALSRGAGEALLVERDPHLCEALRGVAQRLQGGDAASIVQADAVAFLDAPLHGRFDVVFLDPPFADELWERVLERLDAWIADRAWLYLESPLQRSIDAPGWRSHREGRSRETRHALYRRESRMQVCRAATLARTPLDVRVNATT